MITRDKTLPRKDSQESSQRWCSIPGSSLWFSGHFPERPILPGIALVHLIHETLEENLPKDNGAGRYLALRNIRFRKMILPDEDVGVSFGPGDAPSTYRVRVVTRDNKAICDGIVAIQEKPLISSHLDLRCDAGEVNMDVDSFLPHRNEMKLVDKLLCASKDHCATLSVVGNQWPTAHGSRVKALIGIELIAQTSAILTGWTIGPERSREKGAFLVGIRHATLYARNLQVERSLRTTVEQKKGFQNYSVFDGVVRDDSGQPLLSARIQAIHLPSGDINVS